MHGEAGGQLRGHELGSNFGPSISIYIRWGRKSGLFPVLPWAVDNCRASSMNAEAKLSKPGEGPELGTKISQAELKMWTGNGSWWGHNSRESPSFCLWPLQGAPLLRSPASLREGLTPFRSLHVLNQHEAPRLKAVFSLRS